MNDSDAEFLHTTALEWCSFVSEATVNCSPVTLCWNWYVKARNRLRLTKISFAACLDGMCGDKDMAETFPAFDVSVSAAGLGSAAVLLACLRQVMANSSYMRKSMVCIRNSPDCKLTFDFRR